MASSKMEALLNLIMEVPLDEHGLVNRTVFESLRELGHADAEGVLMFCRKYIIHHRRLPLVRRTALLKAMAQLVKDNIDDLGRVAAKKLITLASVEMTKSKDASDEHQEVASRLLLNVGHWFTKEAFDELLSMFQPRMSPFYFVVLALANLCKEHVHFMVPLLKPVLHTVLTMLSAVTEEKTKWVFCFALGIFSESILAYLFDIEEAPDPTVKKNLFFQEFSDAYDILFDVWLPLNEHNVSTAVIETLGQITHLIPFDKLENELPRLIPVILSMYQETSSDFCVTQGLYGVLHTAVERNSEELVLQVDNLLVNLHNQICIAVEQPTNLYSQKQQKEILCCFKLLTPSFTYQIVEFLLLKLENTNNQIRLGTLTVMDHLINMVPLYMASQKNQILTGMKVLVLANDNRVKGKLGQIIYTMACHNYLHLEGGKEMVEFIIRQCALPVVEDGDTTEDSYDVTAYVVTDRALRRWCEDLMRLLIALPIDNVLWPFLFEFIIPVRCTNALATVCNSLVSLAMKKLEAGSTESFLNYKENPNIPGPHALLTRLLTMSSFLHQGKGWCAPALILLQVLGTDIHLAAPQVWEKEFPTLLDYLQENAKKPLLQSQWEEKLVKVLFQTLELIGDGDWLSQLGKEMINHLHSHYNLPQEKGFVYKCLGAVLQLSQNEEVVKRNLQEMLQTVRHNEALEKEGIAFGVGYCAVTHLDTVLILLKEFAKLNIFKKTASYFQIIKDQEDIEIIKVKSTLISCYGHIMSHSPKDLTPFRIDTEIVENVLNHYNIKILGMKIEVKDLTLKLSLIQTVTQLALASQSDETPSYSFSRKVELLNYMQELIRAEPTEALLTSVRKSAINACTSLLKLQPQLGENRQLIQTCLSSVFNLPRLEACTVNEHPNISMAERQTLFHETMESLLDFLKQLLLSDLSPAGLQLVFTNVEIWIQSRKDYAREMAIETSLQLLVFYLEQIGTDEKVSSHNLAVPIGYMVLRCTDPLRVVRETAIECLYVLLYIQLRFAGMPADLKDTELEHLKAIKEGLYHGNCQSLFQVCTDIGKVLSKRTPHDQLLSLLFTLFLGLSDDNSNGSYAASIVTNVLITKCGASLIDVPMIIKTLHKELQPINQLHIIQMVIRSMTCLASQHMAVVLPCLLWFPVPFDDYISEVWRSLLKTNSVAVHSIKYLLDNLKLLYESSKESLFNIMTNAEPHQPQAVICALHQMICNQSSKAVIEILYPQIFSTVLIHLSSSVQARLPRDFFRIQTVRKSSGLPQKPCNATACHYSIEILQALLREAKGNAPEMAEKGGWDLIREPERHHEGIMLLASTMVNIAASQLINIVEQLTPVLANIHQSQRTTAAAYFGELLNHTVVSELMLTDTLVGSLLRCLIDDSPVVQWLAVKGLGNAGTGAPQKMEKHVAKLLPAMVSVMDQNSKLNTLLTVEAMTSVSKIIDHLQEDYAGAILVDLARAMEPFFENRQDKVRAGAFTVLGKLLRFGRMQQNPAYMEHIYSALTSLLLHLNDRSEEVRKVSGLVLTLLGPLLPSERMCQHFQALGLEESALDYENYLSVTSQHMAEDLPDRAIYYIRSCTPFFSSVQTEMRENAVTLATFLMQHAPPAYPKSPAANQMCKELTNLLSDHVQSVRMKTLSGIQRLHMY
ncbi:maestro heat-like repeat-containing protein family member 1 [Carcharodon carcharias]|uniref:maestro heat-like repeat-containing protein family member 1 n=1 Tax=Carcharodon carcharias TaxID=13397 RepID=UPI001B7E59EE|nr:maestro heat-like repeat-containing protein family member 1 [Carcharodon carcharias]